MNELGIGAVNTVHKVVGMGSPYLPPYPPFQNLLDFMLSCWFSELIRSLLEAYTGYECLHPS